MLQRESRPSCPQGQGRETELSEADYSPFVSFFHTILETPPAPVVNLYKFPAHFAAKPVT